MAAVFIDRKNRDVRFSCLLCDLWYYIVTYLVSVGEANDYICFCVPFVNIELCTRLSVGVVVAVTCTTVTLPAV